MENEKMVWGYVPGKGLQRVSSLAQQKHVEKLRKQQEDARRHEQKMKKEAHAS